MCPRKKLPADPSSPASQALLREDLVYSDLIQETTLYQELYKASHLESCTLLVSRPWLGATDDALGRTLLKSLLYVLAERETRPASLILISSAVELACEGAETLSALARMEEEGVALMICGASLNWFKIRGQLRLGYISNMHDIAEVLMQSAKVISLS